MVLAIVTAASGGATVLAQTPQTGRHSGHRSAVAAEAIGITPEQLHQELPGKSLAQVAEAHGKSAADVSSALKTAAHARVDQRIDRAMNHVVSADGAATSPR
jgi:hypothetical protein